MSSATSPLASPSPLPLDDALRARYGDAAPTLPPDPLPGDATIEQLLAHRSVRSFLPQALPPGTLERLIAAAQSAATSSNLHAWSVIAVEDPQRRARFAEWSNRQAHIRVAPLFLVWLADLSRLDRVALRRVSPHAANETLEQFLVAAIDAALAAQNAVLAAEALGLGTVYIGALRNRADQVAAELRLPPRVFPLFGLCVGHPDPAQPAAVKPRLGQDVLLHRETYRDPVEDAAAESSAIARYDATLQAFQAGQGLPAVAWSAQAAQRVATLAALSGRHRTRDVLHQQGFELA